MTENVEFVNSEGEETIEPADPDPDEVDYSQRNKTRLTPHPSGLTNAKTVSECGCDNCHKIVDPLYDGRWNNIAEKFYALDICEDPIAMKVRKAKEAYIRYQGRLYHSESHTSAYERHRYGIYPKILNADRHFLNNFEGLTTVLLTRRIQPTDKNDQWIEPATLDAMLHNSYLMRRINEVAHYRLKKVKDLNYEYIRVTAPTESTATPHEHRYFYIEDPNNKVTIDDFRHIIDEHTENCANAMRKHHQVNEGSHDAVNVRYDPPVVDDKYASDGTRHTAGSQYLVSQLAHLPLGDKLDSATDDPNEPLLEGGMLGWATQSQWFGASNGVPNLNV
jgi:hypothetical protein